MKNSAIQGGVLVALGASSYGVLTTFVKMAYQEGYTTYEVTFSQMLIGFIVLGLLTVFSKGKRKKTTPTQPKSKAILHLMLSGVSIGLTGIFYYLAMQYVSVSIGIVLLMQSVWMGLIVDLVINKIKPTVLKLLSVSIILFGTLLATNVLFGTIKFETLGILFGFLAAMSYTVTLYTSNKVALSLPSISRSKWMVLGGLIVVSLIVFPTLNADFQLDVFYKWGAILALFGTVLPPLLMTSGMPKLNIGVGVIISSVELPVAVLMAYWLLDEKVTFYQWMGIVLILVAIVLMNLRKVKKEM